MEYFKNEKTGLNFSIIFLSLVVIVILVYFFFTNKIINEGKITKAVIIKIQSSKSSSLVLYKYYFNGKIYQSQGATKLRNQDIGKQYYLKLLSTEYGMMRLLEDKPVPVCLQNIDPPFDGWKDFPKCPE
jgi:hypothetical protein